MKNLKENISKISLALLTLSTLMLAACSGGSGQEVQQNVDNTELDDTGIVYNGPDPLNDDVANFKQNVWNNLASEDRCGACHVDGGQEPQFVRADDINLAYQAANTIVDLSAPPLSTMVLKVAEGHNCWQPEASVCADTITNFIASWGNQSGAEPNEIILTPPTYNDVGNSRNYPASASEPAGTSFEETVYPLLTSYCAGCHSEDAATMQQPFFGSSDAEVSYAASRSRMNLGDPSDPEANAVDIANSRFVVRLALDNHNCWSTCSNDADQMEAAIAQFANAILPTEVDENLVLSGSIARDEFVVADTGGRVQPDVVALYQFKTGSGPTVYDTSGIEPDMHLIRTGNTAWVSSWGLRIVEGKAQASTASSSKLYDWISRTGEYSIETWVIPDNVAQEGPARIVTYSGSSETRNFTLGQTLYNYNFMTRSAESDADGMPMLSTDDDDEVLQATLQHVVANYDPINGRSIYVNGDLVAEDELGGNLNEWDNTFALAIGNEVDNMDLFQGTIRLLAIHNQTLSEEAIRANFDAGVGQKFFVMFDVSEHTGHSGENRSFVVFQVEIYDDFSYLFSTPFYIVLDAAGTPVADHGGDITIDGIRIGLNGREATLGQSFANVNVAVSADNYGESGVSLSDLGAIIAQEKGVDGDVFFLSFDSIGASSYERPGEPIVNPVEAGDIEGQSVIGVRHFGEISATLSALTGVPETSVAGIFNTVQQQLPASESIESYLAAHQSGVMQLSVAYCNAKFPQGGSYDSGTVDALIEELAEALLASEEGEDSPTRIMSTQPTKVQIRAELQALSGELSGDTRTTAIAICTAAVGNAAMLVQ